VETLFSEKEPINDLRLFADGSIAYQCGAQIILRANPDRRTELGTGSSLGAVDRNDYVCIDRGELFRLDSEGSRKPVSAKGDLVKKLNQVTIEEPAPLPGTSLVACRLSGVKRPDIWGAREYCGVVDLDKSKFEILDLETFGGRIIASKAAGLFALAAWEVKAGSLYLFNTEGAIVGQFIGTAPAFSPNGKYVAFRREGLIQVAEAGNEDWELTDRFSQPEQGMGRNYNAPVWLNDSTLLYDSNETIFRFDLDKNNAKTVCEVPGLQVRRTSTMTGPFRDGVLAVAATEDGEQLVHIQP
jgi:WD40-like Beta Propeller Repeat